MAREYIPTVLRAKSPERPEAWTICVDDGNGGMGVVSSRAFDKELEALEEIGSAGYCIIHHLPDGTDVPSWYWDDGKWVSFLD